MLKEVITALYLYGTVSSLKLPDFRGFQTPLSLEVTDNDHCPIDIPLTCSNKTSVANSCCFEYPGGVMLQTQFWDYYPPIGPNDTFTLHGLWPDNCDGSYEQFCNNELNIHSVSDVLTDFGETELLDKMKTIWKNFNGNDESLWVHEYNKHGTCMKTLSPHCYGDEYKDGEQIRDFFKVSVDLYEQLPTFDWLEEAGIVPSHDKTYTKQQVEDALTSKFGYEVYIKCNRYQALQEVWYFHHLKGSVKSQKFMPIPSLSRSQCPETGIKFLPKEKVPQFPVPTSTHGSVPTGVPANRGFLKLSGLDGCIISNGNWYRSGTCAQFQLIKADFGGYLLKSSKGYCGINSYGQFACNSKIQQAQFQYDKNTRLVSYGGKSSWSTESRPGKFRQNPITPGDDGEIVFQLKFT